MAQGKPFGAKLLLEGKEVPFIGATITSTVGQASIAYVDLVPQKEILKIKPRTLVQIAVRDFNNPAQDHPYVLAWEGEVFGINFGKTPTSRSFTIQCIDFSSYWDNVLAYFFNATQSLGKGTGEIIRTGLTEADAQKLNLRVEAVTHSESSYYLLLMANKLKEGGDFLDAFVEVYRHIAEVNEFYNLAEDRLRIVDRILLRSSGRLTSLLQEQEGLDWFGRGILGRDSGYSTLRSVVQNLMSIIFHDFVPIPFPARVESDSLSKDPLPSGDKKDRTIGNFIFKPNLYPLPPPACNIFFPDEYASFQFSRNFFREPTRLIYKPELPILSRAGSVALSHTYAPDSFDNFMTGNTDWEDFIGSEDVLVSEDYGRFGEEDSDEESAKTNQGRKREAQFLTNEEKQKGILMAIEGMVPAASSFRDSLSSAGRREFARRIATYMFYKKRFEGRSLQITSHLKLSVVPGCNVLILDDSEAEQNVMAYCSSVTHRIYATEGGYTNTTLSFARTVDEEDLVAELSSEPPIPPWFDEAIFGSFEKVPEEDAVSEAERNGPVYTGSEGLSQFYYDLLGSKGSKAVTSLYEGNATVRSATQRLLEEYRNKKISGDRDLQAFIAKMTNRDYVPLKDAFAFLGATTQTGDLKSTKFLEFKGDRLAGVGEKDESVIAARRAIIDKYRAALQKYRGFRG